MEILHASGEVVKNPTHQISFHTVRALGCLRFLRSEEVVK